ncbi:hypothetical protein PtA15_11A478 [Puccinia triticina]|uniref:Uncharacterized protein n=1 Tax=Puccinia triticina TaxID=208348 RepID=A0ABY7D4D7_9BASI|nr:uncharacterized protein PtA15_11A478 [Puccinia triticina]WAQ89787.1 hypothetical protein PtA15_11A478 [Puccinia triticina]
MRVPVARSDILARRIPGHILPQLDSLTQPYNKKSLLPSSSNRIDRQDPQPTLTQRCSFFDLLTHSRKWLPLGEAWGRRFSRRSASSTWWWYRVLVVDSLGLKARDFPLSSPHLLVSNFVVFPSIQLVQINFASRVLPVALS